MVFEGYIWGDEVFEELMLGGLLVCLKVIVDDRYESNNEFWCFVV